MDRVGRRRSEHALLTSLRSLVHPLFRLEDRDLQPPMRQLQMKSGVKKACRVSKTWNKEHLKRKSRALYKLTRDGLEFEDRARFEVFSIRVEEVELGLEIAHG